MRLRKWWSDFWQLNPAVGIFVKTENFYFDFTYSVKSLHTIVWVPWLLFLELGWVPAIAWLPRMRISCRSIWCSNLESSFLMGVSDRNICDSHFWWEPQVVATDVTLWSSHFFNSYWGRSIKGGHFFTETLGCGT